MKTTKTKSGFISQNSLFFFVYILICFLLINTANATITLPAIFSPGVVLLQNTNANIWGWANPKQPIKIIPSWDNKTYTTSSDSTGYWIVKVATPSASNNSYSISFTENSTYTIVLSNVLIGEVWICSGQSNMVLAVSWDINSASVPNDADYPFIKIFSVPHKATLTVQKDVVSSWISPTSQTVLTNFSAIPFFFARNLYKHLNIPIGIIHTAYGSSTQEAWLSEENFTGIDYVQKLLADSRAGNPPSIEQTIPTGLYNAMLKPLVPFSVKAVCWYQGESNALHPDEYNILLNRFISSWRKEFEQPSLPFLVTQLSGYASSAKDGWSKVQESQYKLSTHDNSISTIITYDLGDSANIHPHNKQDVGTRMLLAAQKLVYSENVQSQGPSVSKIVFDGSSVRLSYKDVGTGLISKNGSSNVNNFMVAGYDKLFYAATASIISPDSLVLVSSKVTNPKYVRYAFSPYNANVNLYNSDGLPAVPFRTDSTTNLSSIQSGDWNDIATWGGIGLPTKDDNVQINSGHVVTSYINSALAITKDLCKNLNVAGVLQISNQQAANYYTNVYGTVSCDGSIIYGQTGSTVKGIYLAFQDKAGLSGIGTVNIDGLNLQSSNSECMLSVPTIKIKSGLQIGGTNSKIIIGPSSNITATTLSPSSSAGQAANASSFDIYGTLKVSKVYLCNNSTDTLKSYITVKNNGSLSVSTTLTPVRGASTVSGTIGGSGCILSIEKGGNFNYSSGNNPMDFTVLGNSVYDPKLEVIYNQGSIINGITIASTQATGIHSLETNTARVFYNYFTNKLIFSESFQTVKIYNTSGQLLLSANPTENFISLPASCKGICIISLMDHNGQTLYTKINVNI